MKRASYFVVLVLAATSLGIIIKWISDVRQRVKLEHCKNNLKQLGLGIQSYHGTYRKFPLATVTHTLGPGEQERVVDLPVEQCASWLFELHPFVEARMDSRFKIDINKPWDAEENRYVADNEYAVALCPSQFDPTAKNDWIMNSYIGILGVGRDAGWQERDDNGRGAFGFQHPITLADFSDGLANTMVLAETNFRNGRWIAGGFATARGLDPQEPPYLLGDRAQFGSFHRNQTLVGMADGSVRSLTGRVSPRIIEALATVTGGEQIEPLPWD